MRSSWKRKLGAAIVLGGMVFAGSANAGVIVSEDFEVGNESGGPWAGGTDTFGTYASNRNYSASPHSGIPGGGGYYGNLISGKGASTNGGPISSAPVDLGAGDALINFDGWLASYTGNPEYTVMEAEFFSGTGGSGASLGTVILADGSLFTAAGGVTEYVDGAGTLNAGDAGSDIKNWSHYVTSNAIPAGAQSVVLVYKGAGGGNGNDGYADNVVISTAVPEPASLALMGIGGLLMLRRRKA